MRGIVGRHTSIRVAGVSELPSLCGTLGRVGLVALECQGEIHAEVVLPEFANQLRQCFIRESWNIEVR